MKIVRFLFGAVCVAIAMGVACMFIAAYLDGARQERRAYGADERPLQKRARLEREADPVARAECSNAVVGITRIVNLHCDTYEQQVRKWTAEAAVEHINARGGIERTNLVMTFDAGAPGPDGYSHLSAFVETSRRPY